MDEVRNLGGGGARLQPFLRFDIDIDRTRAGKRLGSTNIVQENLGEPTIANGAKTLGDACRTIASRGPRQAQWTRSIREKLRVIEMLGRAGQLQHEVRGREGDNLVGCIVVVEIVVVVLQKEHRDRAEIGLVDRGDLRIADALEHGFVVASKNHCGSVEFSGELFRLGRSVPARERRQLVPVHMIADRHQRVRLKAQSPPQQPVADRGRQVSHRLVTARAGEEQDSKSFWTIVRTRERGKLPRLRQSPSVTADERQRIASSRLQAGRIEMPVLSAGIAHAAAHRRVADLKGRSAAERRIEGRLDQHPAVADGRQQMAQARRRPISRRLPIRPVPRPPPPRQSRVPRPKTRAENPAD